MGGSSAAGYDRGPDRSNRRGTRPAPDPVLSCGMRRVPPSLALAVLLALPGCGPARDRATTDGRAPRWFGSVRVPRGDVLRFNNGNEPETIDPALVSGQSDGRIARALFEGLTVPDARTLEPRPGQAARWETSADGLFTLTTVACIGCCSLAPVMMINDETHGRLTPASVRRILRDCRRKLSEKAPDAAPAECREQP